MPKSPQTLNELTARMSSLEQEIENVKTGQQDERYKIALAGTKALKKVIRDKTIPLVERWKAFVAAPLDFKEELQDITELPDEPNMQLYLEYILGEQGQGDTAEIEAEMMLYYFEKGSRDPGWDEALDLPTLMEVILKHNIGSVVLDW